MSHHDVFLTPFRFRPSETKKEKTAYKAIFSFWLGWLVCVIRKKDLVFWRVWKEAVTSTPRAKNSPPDCFLNALSIPAF